MFRLYIFISTLLLTFVSGISGSFADTTVPKVVVSIKPLHSLVSAVLGDLGKPGLIVKQAGSEHGYALKPSDAQMIAQADVIFIADPNMELFLNKPIENLSSKNHVIILSQTPGLTLLPIREGGLFEEHDHVEDQDHGDHSHHYAVDYHFWLDPENAKKIVLYIADTLSKQDKAHADIYHNNAVSYNRRLDEITQNIKSSVSQVKQSNFIVFHDAYHYFEDRFDIHAAGSIALDPERQPGAKRISAIHQLILDKNIVCVFSEPQFPNKLINVVVENTKAKTGTLDPLGMSLPEGPDLYIQLLSSLRDNLVQCLSSK